MCLKKKGTNQFKIFDANHAIFFTDRCFYGQKKASFLYRTSQNIVSRPNVLGKKQ